MNSPDTSTLFADSRQIDTLPSPAALFSRALLRQIGGIRGGAWPAVRLTHTSIPLDETAIRRYASICGFSSAQGVPPTYPHVLAFRLHMLLMTDRRFPYPMLGLIHLANTLRQHRPLRPGMILHIDVSCHIRLKHDKGQVFVVHTAMHDDNELVWDSDSIYLRTGVGDVAGPPYAGVLENFPPVEHLADWTVTGDRGRHYGRVSSDLNPIHLSAWSARLFGFRRAIAHGMWSQAHALATVTPQQPAHTADVRVEFKTPLFLPAQAGLWTARRDGHHFFELRDAQGRKPHLRGSATFS